MDGKTCGSTGNLSRHLKSHLDKIDISTKKQADFMKKFLTQDTAEKIVNIYTNITSTFFVKKKIYFNQFFYSHLVNNRRSTFYGNRMSRIQRTI